MNYKKISEIRDVVFAQIKKITKGQGENDTKIECEVLACTDEKKQKYAYLHFKDYDYEGDYQEFCEKVKNFVGKKYKNAILVMDHDGDRKMLIWVPQDKKVAEIHQVEGIYSDKVNPEKVIESKKIKFK